MGIGPSKFFSWKRRFGKVNEHNAPVPRDHWITEAERQAILAFEAENPTEGYRRLTFMMNDADVVAVSPESARPDVQVDHYIPLKVRLAPTSGAPPVYWRTGDFKHSLVEAGLDARSGRLVSVTVTNLPAASTRERREAPSGLHSEAGCPVMDTANLQGVFTDDPGPVLLHLGPDFVWLDLAPERAPARELRLGSLRFLIGEDDFWIGVLVEGLTAADLSEMRAGIGLS